MSRKDLDPQRDADILGALANTGQPRADERSDEELIAGAMAGLVNPMVAPIEPEPMPYPVVEPANNTTPVVIAVVAAAMAIAAAVTLVVLRPAGLLGQQEGDSAGNLAISQHDDEREEHEAREREAERERKHKTRKRAHVPDDVTDPEDDEEEATTGLLPADCEDVAPGVQVCIDGEARIAAAATAGGGPAKVTLESGRVHVLSELDGESVTVAAGDVRITGRGTVFDVTVASASDSENKVLVVVVSTGVVTVHRDGADTTRIAAGDAFSLTLVTDEEVIDVEEDDGGVHASRPKTRKESPDDMLAKAQRLLGAGKTKQAMRVYETLVKRHASTTAGKTALVSLGRIELKQGRAKQALAHFDAYLAKSAGALVEDARYNRVLALRKLGRTSQERRSIDAFLADYPKSIYAKRLRKRADELDAK